MALKKEGLSISCKKIIVLLSLFLFISGIFAAGTEAKSDKVTVDVKHRMLKGGNVPVIISLKDSAPFENPQGGNAVIQAKGRVSGSQRKIMALLEEEERKGKAKIIKQFWIANAIAVNASPELIERFSELKDVSRIELDSEVRAAGDYTAHTLQGQIDSATSEIRRINATGAWQLGLDGTGISVSVIDTGIDYNHPDIAGRFVRGYDFVNGDSDAMDDNGHGTHVAGIVGGNGAGGTTTGIAPNVSLIGVKVLDRTGVGYESDVISAIEWSVSNGADIISMSLGGGSWDSSNCDPEKTLMANAINNALAFNVTVVAAAGNGGISGVSSPACISGAIAVGAVNSNDEIAGFSSTGFPMRDHGVVAPGVNIASLNLLTTGYVDQSGTSMAAPHVAGMIALLLHAAQRQGTGLPPVQIKDILSNTSIDLGSAGKDDTYGTGRIDAYAAILSIDTAGPSIVANPTGYPNGNTAARNGTAITLNATITDAISGVKNASVNVSAINDFFVNVFLAYGSGFWENSSIVANASDGVYLLNITAYDNLSHVNNTVRLSVTMDSTPPFIINTSVTPSQIEAGSGSFVLKANVSDNISGVAQVTVNLSAAGGLSNQPMQNIGGTWQLAVNTTEVGNFSLDVNATDGAGNYENTSIVINVTDTTPPLVSSAGASPDSIRANGVDYATLTVSASDFAGVSSVRNVTVNLSRVGGDAVQEMQGSGGTWLFNVSTNVTGLNGSLIRLPVNVTDAHNNSNTSASIILGIKKAITAIPGTRNSFNFTVDSTDYNLSITVPESTELSGEPQVAPVEVPAPGDLSYAWVALNISDMSFSMPVLIEVKYNSSLVSGNESKLRLWFYNATSGSWEITDNSSVDIMNETVSGYASHFSVFAPLADVTPPSISGVAESSIDTGSALINWTTDEASQSLVRYGTGSGVYTSAKEDTSNSTSHSMQLTGLSAGTRYYYTVSSTDRSGNIANGSERSFTTSSQESSGSGGGGGGGGGGGPSGENATNIEVKEKYDLHIFKDKTTAYAFTNRSNPVLFINITGNISAGEVNAAVEVLRNTSALVKTPAPGMVYRNINMWVGTSGFAVPRNIKNAEVTFRVESDRVDKGGSVALVRYDTEWVRLPTRKIREDDKFLYYTALTEKFSSFAITMFEAVPAPGTVEVQAANTIQETSSPASPGTTGIQQPEENSKRHTFPRTAVLMVVIPAFFAVVYIHKRKRR